MAEQKDGAVVVTSAPIYFAQREKLVGIAARYAIPTVFFCARLCRCRRPDELRHQLSRRQIVRPASIPAESSKTTQ